MSRTSEVEFETVIKVNLLASGYMPVDRESFDCLFATPVEGARQCKGAVPQRGTSRGVQIG